MPAAHLVDVKQTADEKLLSGFFPNQKQRASIGVEQNADVLRKRTDHRYTTAHDTIQTCYQGWATGQLPPPKVSKLCAVVRIPPPKIVQQQIAIISPHEDISWLRP